MISDKQLTQISKFLSLVLRHQPEKIGIQLDQNGWADITELIEKGHSYGIKFGRETLNHIVTTNSKKRFAFNGTLEKIRASQGHSIEIEIGYTNQKPPEILYHGTGEKSLHSIFDTGLEKRSRQHVHLSGDIETAVKVGQDTGNLLFSKCLLNKCITTISGFSFQAMVFPIDIPHWFGLDNLYSTFYVTSISNQCVT